MKQDPYIVFQNAKGNAIYAVAGWLGAVIGPLLVIAEHSDYESPTFLLVVELSLLAIGSFFHGIKQLKKKVYSDFIVYMVVTIIVFFCHDSYVLLSKSFILKHITSKGRVALRAGRLRSLCFGRYKSELHTISRLKYKEDHGISIKVSGGKRKLVVNGLWTL